MTSSLYRKFRAATLKLQRVLASDLIPVDKLRYLIDEVLIRLNVVSSRGVREYTLVGGGPISLREESTDRKVFAEVFLDRIYAPFTKLIPPEVQPKVLVDLGANIGLSAIFLARELKISDIVAVEPDQDNFALLEQNLVASGLLSAPDRISKPASRKSSRKNNPAGSSTPANCDREGCAKVDRVIGINRVSRAIAAFAGARRGYAPILDSGNGAWGLRMGDMHLDAPPQNNLSRELCSRQSIPVLPLIDLIPRADSNGAAIKGLIVKCDIEGAERDLFPRIRDWDHCVDLIILELHTEFFTSAQLQESLHQSRYCWHMHGEIPENALLAVVGLERGERKIERVPSEMAAAG